MRTSYQQFLILFEQLIGDEWTFLYKKYHQKLQLKNQNIATKKIQTIIESTTYLAHKQGFQSMSMRDLSEHCQMSIGGLYKYFQNKNQLASMIHNGLIEMGSVCLKQFADHDKDPIPELYAMLTRHLYLSEKLKKWFNFVFMEGKHIDRALMKLFIRSEIQMEQAIEKKIIAAQKLGHCECPNPEFTASMIKAMLQDWYTKTWKYQKRNITIDDYAEFMWQDICAMIKIENEQNNSKKLYQYATRH